MSVKFKVIQRVNPLSATNESKYYAQAVADGELSFEELLDILSNKSRLHPADCIKFMMLLDETIQEQLKDGKIVRLGNIGSFQLGINSKGYATEKQVTPSTINNAKVNYRPGKRFKEMLEGLSYKKVKE